MLSTLHHSARAVRSVATVFPAIRKATTDTQKRAGDISDAFVSLSGKQFTPLPSRYADLKSRLTAGHEDAVRSSWERLLADLTDEIPLIAALGPKVVPDIDFKDIGSPSDDFQKEYKKRGVAVIRNVVPEHEALQWKEDIREYVRQNPHTKAFPADNPQVFELYWSPSQLKARAHTNMLAAQRFLMEFWHSKDPNALISTSHPTSYADRLRIRLPGDAKFALGPHIDGGSVERWEEEGYGKGKVYDKIFEGKWEEYDPWESSCRVPVVSDMYQGVGAASMFRMSQAWLALSTTGPFEGTLKVNPLLAKATAYLLLRPFFAPKQSSPSSDNFLRPDNWTMESPITSSLQGANPGHGQELSDSLHPHLKLEQSMVHIPRVNPGDYVAWHCDTIHAVDKVHAGTGDSSVLYIPACPLTEGNAQGLRRQRHAFIQGVPSPDFGGGKGEKNHKGRWGVEELTKVANVEGQRAFGLEAWDSTEAGLTPGQREVMDRANKILGFYQ